MEPPEETLPPNLNWPAFRSAYAQLRRGASSDEVSLAWRRYKTLHSISTAPARSPTRRSPPRTSPKRATKVRTTKNSARRSPMRLPNTVTRVEGAGGSVLERLPGDIRRYIPSIDPRVAPRFQVLSRALRAVRTDAYATLCELPIGVRELDLLLDRRRWLLDLNPDMEQTGIWVGVYQPRRLLLNTLGSEWYFPIYVELRVRGMRLVYGVEPRQRTVTVTDELYDRLGWQFVKQLVLDSYREEATEPHPEWEGVDPSEYQVVFDRVSAYDVLQRRVQCVATNPSYAADRSEEAIVSLWRQVVARYSSLAISEELRAHALRNLILNYVNGDLEAINPLDEAQVRTLIREDVPPPALLDPTLSLPFPLRRCDETVGVRVLTAYLEYLLTTPYTNLTWVSQGEDGTWEATSVRIYNRENSRSYTGVRYGLASKPSRYLGGEVLVDENKASRISNTKMAYTIDEVVNIYLSTPGAVLSAPNLRRVSLIQEGCVLRDRRYPATRTLRDIRRVFDAALRPYDVTLDALLDTPDYLSRFATKRTLTPAAFSLVSTLTFLSKHLLGKQHSYVRGDTYLELSAPYASFPRVSRWVTTQLRAFFRR